MKSVLLVFMVLSLTACATTNPPSRYIKNNASDEEFAEVSYQCKKKTIRVVTNEIRDAYGNVTPELDLVNCSKFNACMASKGFIKSPTGFFVISNDKTIDCKE